MDNLNHNIKCNVKTCEYHAEQNNFCTLDCINVGCCDTDAPQNCGYTQCSSFCACK